MWAFELVCVCVYRVLIKIYRRDNTHYSEVRSGDNDDIKGRRVICV